MMSTVNTTTPPTTEAAMMVVVLREDGDGPGPPGPLEEDGLWQEDESALNKTLSAEPLLNCVALHAANGSKVPYNYS